MAVDVWESPTTLLKLRNSLEFFYEEIKICNSRHWLVKSVRTLSVKIGPSSFITKDLLMWD